MTVLFRKKRFWLGCVAVLLVIATAGYFVGGYFFKSRPPVPLARTVTLPKAADADYQKVLDDFEDGEFNMDGSVADFVGYKTIDASPRWSNSII